MWGCQGREAAKADECILVCTTKQDICVTAWHLKAGDRICEYEVNATAYVPCARTLPMPA